MDKEKFIIFLERICAVYDILDSSSADDDSMYYTGQLVMARILLDSVKNGFFDMKN